MAKFILEIDCDSEAFDDGYTELTKLLIQAANHVQDGRFSWQLTDTNGNRVGGHRYDPDL